MVVPPSCRVPVVVGHVLAQVQLVRYGAANVPDCRLLSGPHPHRLVVRQFRNRSCIPRRLPRNHSLAQGQKKRVASPSSPTKCVKYSEFIV